ncbi:hypothetical protein CROQUDRAFT_97062 [Cronartium quercuum f. sp. fusiforme G11]|uniref:Uncharacterized protein n=1 Tax=Cronartium quercuum f. sp. fusiforme G11 TaxID=708437 RepID=A0A9P6T8B3_9BASI|nr:hypothetical protein CROQUDRAFT_97062 [Cronartium quercuum f. sp. fusiforme G11]
MLVRNWVPSGNRLAMQVDGSGGRPGGDSWDFKSLGGEGAAFKALGQLLFVEG